MSLSQRELHGEETHRLSVKEKVLGTAVSKLHADSLLRHERPYHY